MSTDRRYFLRNSAMLAAAAAVDVPLGVAAKADAPAASVVVPSPYEVKPLPIDPTKVQGLSEKLLVSHHDNNYAGAVKRLNAIAAELGRLDWATAPSFVVNGLKREELIAANSMILHEHYFNVLGGDGKTGASLAKAIASDFGSMDRWRAEFSAMGKAEGGGSGWVVLCYSDRLQRLVNSWASDHTTTLAAGRPVLVLDMYEHAYHMDYGAKAAAYVEAFMSGIRWDYSEKLFESYVRSA
jgi:Fe-Mn family superoxide dismutase